MKSLSSDLIAVGLSVLITGGSSGILYNDFTKKIDAGQNRQIGTISFKKRVAQRKYAKQVVWEDIEQNSPVFSNDSIRTSDISEAVIHLDDGTAINVDENSLILLAAAKDAININFEQGSISASRSGLGDSYFGKINIQSKNTIVSIEKSDVTLSKSDTDELDLTVSRGTAQLKAGGGAAQTILKDQKVIIDPVSSGTKVTDISLQLTAPSDSGYIISSDPQAAVTFSWQELKDVKPSLEVSSDRLFAKPLITRLNAVSGTAGYLAPGTYYWRIKALNPDSKKMEFSEARRFSVLRDRPVVPAYPGEDARISYTANPPLINFRWTGNDLASSYIIEVSKDREFKNIVKTSQTRLTAISFDNLPDGTYFWRVATRVSIPGNEKYSSVTMPYMFRVEKLQAAVPVRLISPLPDSRIDRKMISANGIVFSWKPDSSAQKYELQFSRDINFTVPEFTAESISNYLNVTREFQPGDYFWRVKTFSPAAAGTVLSAPRQLKIIEAVGLNLKNPPDNSDMALEEGARGLKVDFSWGAVSLDGYYLFELARDSTMVNIVKRTALNADSAKVDALRAGAYFWRVKYLDRNKNEISASPVFSFTVTVPVKVQTVPEAAVPAAGPALADVKTPETDKASPVTRIIIASPVRGSAIYIDNRFRGYGKVDIEADPDKIYNLAVKTPGYDDYTVKITPEKNKSTEIKPALVKIVRLDRIKWRSKLASSIITDAVVEKNSLYFATADYRLNKTDLNGNIIWRTQLDAILKSEPGFDSDSVYVVDVLSNLYAINSKDGKIKWRKKTAGPLLFAGKPVVIDSNVCVAATSGILQVFSSEGEELWQEDLEAGIFGPVTYRDGIIYIATDQNLVMAVYAKNGRVRWRFPVSDRIVSCPPAYYKGNIYVGDMSGMLYMIEAGRGRGISKADLKSAVQGAPFFFNDMLVIPTRKGRVFALSTSDLKEIWKFDARPGEIFNANPNIFESTVLFSTPFRVYARNIKNGKAEWETEAGARINTGVTVKDENIYVGLGSGELVSIRYDLTVKIQQ
jgi:outer membrane protein assembly factor BamB